MGVRPASDPNLPTLFIVGDSTVSNGQDGKVARASQDYGKWAGRVAKAEGAPFVDLNEIIAKHYEEMGQAKVTAVCFPPGERTHTAAAGAQLNATCVVEGLRALENCPLVGFLKGGG